MIELGDLNYAELLAHLRKDLQLDLSTDAQPHRLPDMGQTISGQGVVWDGKQWVAASAPLRAANNLSDLTSASAARLHLGISWGEVTTGTGAVVQSGSGDWSVLGTATGAVQVGAFGTIAGVVGSLAGGRATTNHYWTIQVADGASPTISSWQDGILTSGFSVQFIAIHN